MPDVVASERFHIRDENDGVADERHLGVVPVLDRRYGGVVEDETRKKAVDGGALVQNNRYCIPQVHDSFEPCAIPPEPRRSGRSPRLLIK